MNVIWCVHGESRGGETFIRDLRSTQESTTSVDSHWGEWRRVEQTRGDQMTPAEDRGAGL